jgi:hypothetical protein
MSAPTLDRTKHKAEVDATVQKLRAKCRRAIRQRLRAIEQQAGATYVAWRVNMKPAEAEALIYGKGELSLDQLSDLGLAVGIEFKFNLVPKGKKK